MLIEHGSNIDSQDIQGWTPLHSAAQNEHLDVLKLLLDSGADIGMRNGRDKTALDIVRDSGKRDVVNFLAKHEGNLGIRLGNPVRSTSLEAEQQKIVLPGVEPPRTCDNADEEETDEDQSTSLHSAVENGSIVGIKRLLDRGADVNEQNDRLRTPLHVASRHGKLEIARTLIDSGADMKCRDVDGWTPLHLAARPGDVDTSQLLLDNLNSAEVDAAQWDYQTSLHLASINGYLPIVLLLLEWGANVQARNSYGRTPSQEASFRGYREVVWKLSEYGA